MYLLFLIFAPTLILGGFMVWKTFCESGSSQTFNQRNYGTLWCYQQLISESSSKINDPKVDISEKLKYAQKAVDSYSRLQSFCSQSRSGEEWFHLTCQSPSSRAKEAVSHYTGLLSELQRFHSNFFPVVSSDEKIQSDWAVLPCDHDSYEQLTRQKRSIRTLPVYIDHDMRFAFFLSNSMDSIYSVSLFSCTCPDHEKRVLPCKHMYRLFYELTVGTDYTTGVNVSNLDSVTGFFELSDEDKVSYISTVRILCGRKNRPLTTRKLPHIVKALQTGLLLQSDSVDYPSLLNARTKDEILISLRDFEITDCYPSWTKVRLIDYVTENHRQYLSEEYKDFTAVTIPPVLEPWCNGFCSVIESRFTGNTDFLEEWDHRFDKFL